MRERSESESRAIFYYHSTSSRSLLLLPSHALTSSAASFQSNLSLSPSLSPHPPHIPLISPQKKARLGMMLFEDSNKKRRHGMPAQGNSFSPLPPHLQAIGKITAAAPDCPGTRQVVASPDYCLFSSLPASLSLLPFQP